MCFRKLLLFGLFILLPFQFFGQYFTMGEDPARTKWFQIKARHFQIIFPEDYKEQANYTANLLTYFYDRVNQDLEAEPQKISVIIHNKSVTSNGFVAPAPDRMELHTLPPQDNAVVPWLEHLCIHELRHVVQISKLRQGITKIFSYLLGEQAVAGVAGMIPMWYLEGDAVISETDWTQGGRGSLPTFSKELRAHFLDNEEDYSYNKMLMGSFKNYTPDHYRLGYHMVRYAREKFGDNIVKDLENYVAKHSFLFFPFPLALKKSTGLFPGALYKEAFSYYDSSWTASYDTLELNRQNEITERKSDEYISYTSPIFFDDTTILALRKDLSHSAAFVKITPSSEEKLFIPGKMTSRRFSYANHKIAWSEMQPDLRWGNRSYSIIKVLDLNTGKVNKLSSKTRYFAPSLSGNGKIASIKINDSQSYALVIQDTETGEIINEYPSPDGYFIQKPEWGNNSSFVYVAGLSGKGKTVYRLDLSSKKWEQVLPVTKYDIQDLSLSGDYLYFHATYSGIDNIYAKNLDTDSVFKITNARYGAMFSDVKHDRQLIYSNYSAEGYKIYQKNLTKEAYSFFDVDSIKNSYKQNYSELPDRGKIVTKEYSIKRYRKWKNLFNFHSWAPFYADYSISSQSVSSVSPGVLLLSQNDLGTALSTIGYSYNSGVHKFHTQFHYTGWYPKFSIKSNYGGDPEIFTSAMHNLVHQAVNTYFDLQFDIAVPFTLEKGKYTTKLTSSVNYDYKRNYYFDFDEMKYQEGINLIDYNLFLYRLRSMAYRDIQPKTGFIIDLNARTSPFNDNITGSLYSAKGRLFLPGFFEDHGIKLSAGFQHQYPEALIFGNYVRHPRGYIENYDEQLYSYKIDYALPLFYPDWSVGSLLYIKRFKLGLFYDYAIAKNKHYVDNLIRKTWQSEIFQSYGIELTTDFHLARMFFPLNAGIRYSYLPYLDHTNIEFIFSVDLYRIYTNSK